jgi:hypothetical protein
MLEIRKSGERGSTRLSWLKSRHSFSFGGYKDPQEMGFSDLRVINDDWVIPGKGFGQHSHRNVEILTYVLQGTLAHRDTLNNSSKIKPGDVQLISAGTGIEHSEFNASSTHPVHFLQIWLTPQKARTKPFYQQRYFSPELKLGKLKLIASPNGHGDSLVIQQDAKIYAGQFDNDDRHSLGITHKRCIYVHVVSGKLKINGTPVGEGDGIKIEDSQEVGFTDATKAEVLVFDLRSGKSKLPKSRSNDLCTTRACRRRN